MAGERLSSVVEPFFSTFLRANGFQKKREFYDPKNFGNELLVFESNELRIRFIQEQGDIFADVGPAFEDNWYFLDYVLELAEGKENPPRDSPASLDDLASRIQENFSKVKELFSELNYSKTREQLEILSRRKTKEMFGPDKQ